MFTIRPAESGELSWMIEAAANEGWNPGIHDAAPFYAADPEGFLLGILDGQPIGCISSVSYQGVFGFIGFYIMAPSFRGKGYGIQLWNAAMEKLRGQVIGLDGVVDQQANYAKSGFQWMYGNIRFEHLNTTPSKSALSEGIVPADSVPIEKLARYDAGIFPVERAAFLAKWIAMPESHAFIARKNDHITGYGVIRKCRTGYKIGPLFADTPEIATELHGALYARAPLGESIYLDVPEVNEAAMRLALGHGMTKVFVTARMYANGVPASDTDRTYGVTTFELG